MRLSEIARMLGGELSGDPSAEITGVSGIEDARDGEITFVADKKHASSAHKSGASCIIVKEFIEGLRAAQIKVKDPQRGFVSLLEFFYVKPYEPGGISSRALIEDGASLGEDVTVWPFAFVSGGASIGRRTTLHPFVFIGAGVKVGEDCIIRPGVVIREKAVIGDRVIIHAGAVIGADGFGYVRDGGRHRKIPQVGGVVIGDDVEIGANTTIDRATVGATRIGRGTKIDNLVQIAHNVTIGEDSIIVSQTGIAGSSVIGNSVILAGQVGVSDHVKVSDGAILAARSGVMRDIPAGQAYSGAPALPHREWLKVISLFNRLPELNRKIHELEDKIKALEGSKTL